MAAPTGDTIRAALTDVLTAHQPARASKDRYDYWRIHCGGCQWAGSPWESRALAEAEHHRHQSDALTPTVQQLIAQAVTTARADAWETAAAMLTEPMAGDFRARAAGLRGTGS